MHRLLILLGFLGFLSACGAEQVWAPDEAVARARYTHPGPPAITLFTVISNSTGEGGHSALMVSGSQRVIFDPAGSWGHTYVPERNDVLFGITPLREEFYIDYHARTTYHVVIQTVEVSPAVAERALALVQAQGAAPKAFCANSVSTVLGQLPGFEHIRGTFFPKKIMDRFGQVPGVKTETVYDDDDDNNQPLLRVQQNTAG
ncbi:MAG: hypothetical protein R3D84_10860 [Paracoccaceae bacterium]